MSQALPVSGYVNVSVNLTPAGAQAQNLNTLLILTDSQIIDQTERLRYYTSLAAVAQDFGTGVPAYLAAQAYFSQSPQPSAVYCGRWCNTAAGGGLRCAPISADVTPWKSITNGSFAVQKDGGSVTNITGLNFSGAGSMTAVANIITTGLAALNITVSWDANYQRFTFQSPTFGAAAAVSFLTATGSGTDIASLLKGRSTDSGAYVFVGNAGETISAALNLFDLNYGQQWYAAVVPGASPSQQVEAAAAVEAMSNRHVLGVNTQDTGHLVSGSTTVVGYLLKQAGYKKTMVQYSSSSPYAVCSLMGRAITTNWDANNTVIDLMYKQEPGITPEAINSTQAAALASYNVNAFVSVANGANIIQWGNMSSGDAIDAITGTDWLAIALQNACFNALYTSPTKIPQTDPGTNVLVGVCADVCSKAKNNGLLGPGVWTSAGFGLLKQNDFLSNGFYIYANPLSSQSAADRAARKAPPIQIAAKLAGAFRTMDVAVTVNR